MIIDLKTALHQAQTYQELLTIAKKLRAGLSPWGCQYATVTDQSSIYQGTIAVGAVAEKAMKIRQRMERDGTKFTLEEKENVVLLSREISRLYGEDKANCESADKLTTLSRFVMSVIFWVNHQSKWNNNRNGPSYKEQLEQPLSIRLKTAVNKAQNFQELFAVANELHAGLSCWGYQYAYAPISTSIDKEVIYTGRIAVGTVHKKAMQIRERMKKNGIGFNTAEKKNVDLLCGQIIDIYEEDRDNCARAGKITTICRLFMQVIFWMDHQEKWGDPEDPLDEFRKIMSDRWVLRSDLPNSVYDNPPIELEIRPEENRRHMTIQDGTAIDWGNLTT